MLERDPPAVVALAPVLPWWFAQRDTIALLRFAWRVDSLARRDSARPLANVARRYVADAARAYIILAREGSAAALLAFASLPDSACGLWWISCRAQKLTEARLLEVVDENRRAMELRDRWAALDPLDRWAGQEPLVVLEQARLAERLGDREKAVKSYQFVANVWRHADPELQRYVGEARSALARLTREPGERQ
jgi:hypothetical protein